MFIRWLWVMMVYGLGSSRGLTALLGGKYHTLVGLLIDLHKVKEWQQQWKFYICVLSPKGEAITQR